nr:YlxR family protein [Marinithermus hydrothermalis]
MCVSCRRRRPKRELLRIVRTPEGFVIDRTGKRPGRGAYVCPDTPTCWEEKRLRRFAGGSAARLALELQAVLGGEVRDGEGAHLPTGQGTGDGERGAHGAPGHDGGGV